MPGRSATASVSEAAPSFAALDGRRTSSAAGINSTHAAIPMVIIATRQLYVEISQRANGEMVIGATPIPAETRETARLRLLSNHLVVAAIIGAKKLPAARPATTPQANWNSMD